MKHLSEAFQNTLLFLGLALGAPTLLALTAMSPPYVGNIIQYSLAGLFVLERSMRYKETIKGCIDKLEEKTQNWLYLNWSLDSLANMKHHFQNIKSISDLASLAYSLVHDFIILITLGSIAACVAKVIFILLTASVFMLQELLNAPLLSALMTANYALMAYLAHNIFVDIWSAVLEKCPSLGVSVNDLKSSFSNDSAHNTLKKILLFTASCALKLLLTISITIPFLASRRLLVHAPIELLATSLKSAVMHRFFSLSVVSNWLLLTYHNLTASPRKEDEGSLLERVSEKFQALVSGVSSFASSVSSFASSVLSLPSIMLALLTECTQSLSNLMKPRKSPIEVTYFDIGRDFVTVDSTQQDQGPNAQGPDALTKKRERAKNI